MRYSLRCAAVVSNKKRPGETEALKLASDFTFGRLTRPLCARIKLGKYLFLHHDGKIVVFGHFVRVLRSIAGILAGANHTPHKISTISKAIVNEASRLNNDAAGWIKNSKSSGSGRAGRYCCLCREGGCSQADDYTSG
jgi:hypothetical protein